MRNLDRAPWGWFVSDPQCLGPQLGRLGHLGALSAASLTYGGWAGLSQRLILAGMQTKCPHVEELFALGFSQDVGWVLENEPFKRTRQKRHSLRSCMWIVLPYSVGWSSHGFSQVQEKRAKIPSFSGTGIKEFGPCFLTTTNAL